MISGAQVPMWPPIRSAEGTLIREAVARVGVRRDATPPLRDPAIGLRLRRVQVTRHLAALGPEQVIRHDVPRS